MEEAETLSTRIGIMDSGRLRCIGTQAHLKARFGDGFKLTLSLDVKPDDSLLARLERFVKRNLCARATRDLVTAKTVVFKLPRDAFDEVVGIFRRMEVHAEEVRERYHVVEYGVAQACLEDVFMNTVTGEGSGVDRERVLGEAAMASAGWS
jgi:ABC-type multidrug transport system ATPase subunit